MRTANSELSTDESHTALSGAAQCRRLRIINTPMAQELISELNSFEVDCREHAL
jgi:hypothetical protein